MTRFFSRERRHYYFRVLSHPVDSFYEIRHRERGSVPIALICVFLFGLSFTVNRVFANFIVNNVNPRSVDLVSEMSSIFALVLLFGAGNWSVTCLMNGEGRFKDILTVVGYSLTPMILLYVPCTLASHFIASGEEIFYQLVMIFAAVWTAALLFIGIMTVHNYTLGKTIVTLLLTLVAVFIIIFLFLLLADLLNQVVGFFSSVYTELIFRY